MSTHDESAGESWHGTKYGYNVHRCRCEGCVDASRAYDLARFQRRKAERVAVGGRLVHPTAPHGTENAYKHYSCRCQVCREVAVRAAVERSRRRATRRGVAS